MDMRRRDRSYTIENIKKNLEQVEFIKIDDHKKFSAGVTGILDSYRVWYGKMPSGRYVYMYSFSSYEK